MATKSTGKQCEPVLRLHARILFRNQQGEIVDVTKDSPYALKKLTEDGSLAIHILNQCRKRLDLLFMAAEHRSQIDAGLVRLAVEDLKLDLEEGSELAGYVYCTQELFEHSEALPPLLTPDSRKAGRSLTIIKPA